MLKFALINFDTTYFTELGIVDGVLVWKTKSEDDLGLHYFAKPPDIDASLDDKEAVRCFYRRFALDSGLGVVEIKVVKFNDLPVIRKIFKIPQNRDGTGTMYIGSIALPFRDFTYIIIVKCLEHGITGMREALVSAQLLKFNHDNL